MFTASDKGRYFSPETVWGWRDHGPASCTTSAPLGCGGPLSAHPQLNAPPAHSIELAKANQAANKWPIELEERRGGQKNAAAVKMWKKSPEQLCDLVKGAMGTRAWRMERWVRERGNSSESFVSMAGTEGIEREYTNTGSPSLQDVQCPTCSRRGLGCRLLTTAGTYCTISDEQRKLNSRKRGGVFVDVFLNNNHTDQLNSIFTGYCSSSTFPCLWPVCNTCIHAEGYLILWAIHEVLS